MELTATSMRSMGSGDRIGHKRSRRSVGRNSRTGAPGPRRSVQENQDLELVDVACGDLASRVEEIITLGKSKYDTSRDSKQLVLKGPYRPVQGNRVKKISAAPGYKFSFDFKLEEVPRHDANIVHLTVRGLKDTAMPRVSVAAGTKRLKLFMQLGNAHVELLDQEDVQLHKDYKVTVEYRNETLTFRVGNHEARVERELLLKVPVPSMLEVYISNPTMEAAKGTVSLMMFEPHFEDALIVSARRRVKELELPPEETKLLQHARRDIERNQRWARFDAFFGVFICANSIMVGLEMEYNTDGDVSWIVFDNLFILIFVFELIMRLKLSHVRTIRQFMSDGWLVFDAFVILQAMVETWVLPGLPGYLGLLRLVRALKLAKMVRLVRAFRELGMLVEGILNSFHTLMWTLVLLVLVTYIGALILVRTAKIGLEFDSPDKLARLDELLSVPSAMARLVAMATFDKWAQYIRNIAFGVGGIKGAVLCVELIGFLGFVGIGILNMVAGILCHTAFILNQKYKHMKAVEVLLLQQKAMKSLRHTLSTWGERPLFQNDRYIGMDEFFEVINCTQVMESTDAPDHGTTGKPHEPPDFPPNEAARLLNLTGEELLSLCDTFAEDGQIEIDGIMEAIMTKELQAYYGLKSADWIGGKKKSTLRPVDMVSFTYSVKLAEKFVSSVERNLTGTCSMAYDTLHFLHEQSKKANTLLRMERPDWSPPTNQPALSPVLVDVKDLESCVNLQQYSGEESRLFMPIDTSFGLLNVANSIFIGIDMSYEGDDETIFYVIDCFFTFVFLVEFIIRLVLFTVLGQMQETGTEVGNMNDISKRRLEKVSALRKRMRLWIFPPCPENCCVSVCASLPKMLQEVPALLDFIIVLVSVADSAIIANLRRLGLTDADPSVLSLLRVFRVFRLARAFRIFRMFPMLQLFIFALFRVWKTVAWTFALMILFIYMYGLYAHVVLEPIPELKPFFGGLGTSILTGWRLTTFDNWMEIIVETGKVSPVNVITLYVLIIFIGLGLMKMLIGVMSESAISLMQTREQERAKEEMNIFLLEMTKLRQLFYDRFETDTMPQEFVEKALGICIRPKRSGPLTPADGVIPLPPQKMKEGLTGDFSLQLLKIFSRAKLSPDLVKQIFERVDHARCGYVNINSFALCGMAVKEDASYSNVFAAITAVRQLRQLVKELSSKLKSIHQKMESLLEDVSTLVTRTKYTPRPSRSSKAPRNLGRFGPEAEAAIEELTNFSGTSPAVKSMGKFKVVNGRGKLIFNFDEAQGQGTALRGEVKPGDMLIVGLPVGPEPEEGVETEREEKMLAITVHSIIGHERIKLMQKFPTEYTKRPFNFMVVKSSTADANPPPEAKDVDYTHNLQLHSQLSPRSAQLFIEWELGTKRRHDAKFNKLALEKHELTLEMFELMRDLDALANLEVVKEVFLFWTKAKGMKEPEDN